MPCGTGARAEILCATKRGTDYFFEVGGFLGIGHGLDADIARLEIVAAFLRQGNLGGGVSVRRSEKIGERLEFIVVGFSSLGETPCAGVFLRGGVFGARKWEILGRTLVLFFAKFAFYASIFPQENSYFITFRRILKILERTSVLFEKFGEKIPGKFSRSIKGKSISL